MFFCPYAAEQAQLGQSVLMAQKVGSEERFDSSKRSERPQESLQDIVLEPGCGCECVTRGYFIRSWDESLFGEEINKSQEDKWLKDRRSGATRGCKLFVWKKVEQDVPKLLEKEGGRCCYEANVKEDGMSLYVTFTEASPDFQAHSRFSLVVFFHIISVSPCSSYPRMQTRKLHSALQ